VNTNNPLDDIFAAFEHDNFEQAPAPAAPERKIPFTNTPAAFTENCPKCGGSGIFVFNNGRTGQCFTCQGRGKLSFKTSAADRAKARERNAEKVVQKRIDKQASINAFKTEQPAVWAWMLENEKLNGTGKEFGFAVQMFEALTEYGHLTERQLAAAQACIAKREAARAARAAEATQAAPAVDNAGIDRLKAAFDHAMNKAGAKGRGLRNPRITIGDMTISPAKATSANPGALYVKSGTDYLGKIKDGRFMAIPACTSEQQAKILAFVADPKAAAEAYGKETGVCCICNATLTNAESIERGIGPICAERYGW
jgi:Family of unknown function (DUF6011)